MKLIEKVRPNLIEKLKSSDSFMDKEILEAFKTTEFISELKFEIVIQLFISHNIDMYKIYEEILKEKFKH